MRSRRHRLVPYIIVCVSVFARRTSHLQPTNPTHYWRAVPRGYNGPYINISRAETKTPHFNMCAVGKSLRKMSVMAFYLSPLLDGLSYILYIVYIHISYLMRVKCWKIQDTLNKKQTALGKELSTEFYGQHPSAPCLLMASYMRCVSKVSTPPERRLCDF